MSMRHSSDLEDDVPDDSEPDEELDDRIFSQDTSDNAAFVAFGAGLPPEEALSLLDDLIQNDEDESDRTEQEF